MSVSIWISAHYLYKFFFFCLLTFEILINYTLLRQYTLLTSILTFYQRKYSKIYFTGNDLCLSICVLYPVSSVINSLYLYIRYVNYVNALIDLIK